MPSVNSFSGSLGISNCRRAVVEAQRLFWLAGRSWEAVEVDLAHAVVRAEPARRTGRGPYLERCRGPHGQFVCERILSVLRVRDQPEDAAAHTGSRERDGRPLPPARRPCRSRPHRLAHLRRRPNQRGAGAPARSTTARACAISSLQQCLPDEVEQAVLREAFLDLVGARGGGAGGGRNEDDASVFPGFCPNKTSCHFQAVGGECIVHAEFDAPGRGPERWERA